MFSFTKYPEKNRLEFKLNFACFWYSLACKKVQTAFLGQKKIDQDKLY